MANRGAVDELGEALRRFAPRAVVTCARGSSDHAATYARYLIETRTGLLASSAAPSVSSLYATKADLESVLFLAISQSGASPDLLAAARAARDAGALVVALVNAEESPLARAASHSIPLRAGLESSVAATKSYIASLTAIVQLVGSWTQDDELRAALEGAPEQLAQRVATGLERGDRAPAISQQSVRRRPRARSRCCPGGRTQAQGNLRPARRGIQLGGTAPRPGRTGRPGIPGARVRATR